MLLGSSSWYQGAVEKYTKGTGSYNKYHRGRLDGTLIIKNISYAEAGKYECVVNSAVGTIYAHSEGNNIKIPKRFMDKSKCHLIRVKNRILLLKYFL